VKRLDTAVKIDTDAIANLSSIIKDNMIQVHDEFQKIARDILWLNVTLFGQSELHTMIRQLEFTLFQLVQQVDELFNIIQCAMHGRLSIKLVNPTVLQNIMRNVTLHLPEGFELIAGTSMENILLYYELTTVSIVANTHCINLLLNVPLKSANHYFTLFKVISLPTRVSFNKFVQYSVDYSYLGIQNSQRAYLMLTEADYSRCKKASITICPANMPVYNTQKVTCLSSLFFQSANTRRVCQRKLILQHQTPTLQRHGKVWIFHFPTRHQISLRCPGNNEPLHRTITLYESGILHNASECHIVSDEVQIFPDLYGTSQAELEKPRFYLPDNISVVTDDETKQLEDISPAEIRRLDDVQAKIATLKQTFDVDSLLHIHKTTLLQKQTTHWFIIITTSICATLILGTLGFLFYLRFHYILRIVPKPNNMTCSSPSPTTALPLENIEPKNEQPKTEQQEQRVLFTSYPTSSY